jgi:toxin HigB-1
VIGEFRSKGLKELFEKGKSKRLRPDLVGRTRRRLDALHAATELSQLKIPGFDFHPLHGHPQRYSIHVNGPWAITFGWEDGYALDVDLEQYH